MEKHLIVVGIFHSVGAEETSSDLMNSNFRENNVMRCLGESLYVKVKICLSEIAKTVLAAN